MIDILEYIHDMHIIHRDIKPDNFVLGRGDKSKHLFLLDFGLAKKYRSSKTLKHYPMIKRKNLTGTARYASITLLISSYIFLGWLAKGADPFNTVHRYSYWAKRPSIASAWEYHRHANDELHARRLQPNNGYSDAYAIRFPTN